MRRKILLTGFARKLKGSFMISGIINVYKEKGFTSHDVVAKLRGILRQKKIGHTGTLDPDAEGVLPVCLGKATKVCDLLTDKDKEYEAVLLLGKATDTQDISGKVLKESPVSCQEEEVRAIIAGFVGNYSQIPPMYSALKVDGRKLCDLARAGKEVERAPRNVQIFSIDILEIALPRVRMRVHCSKGTYIRTLCHDIGQALGCGGTMAALRRTRVGQFDIGQAVTLDELVQAPDPAAFLRGVETCFAQSGVTIQGLALKRALCGNPFPLDAPAGEYKVFDPEGDFLLLGRCDGKECRIIKSFYEVEQP